MIRIIVTFLLWVGAVVAWYCAARKHEHMFYKGATKQRIGSWEIFWQSFSVCMMFEFIRLVAP